MKTNFVHPETRVLDIVPKKILHSATFLEIFSSIFLENENYLVVFGWNLDHFLVWACKTTGKIIVNLKIQEDAIASSCWLRLCSQSVTTLTYIWNLHYNHPWWPDHPWSPQSLLWILHAPRLKYNHTSHSFRPYCFSASEQECKLNTKAIGYVGSKNVTSQGSPCLVWASVIDSPYVAYLPDVVTTDASNHCRNIMGDRPWDLPSCLVRNSDQTTSVQACDVPYCGRGYQLDCDH